MFDDSKTPWIIEGNLKPPSSQAAKSDFERARSEIEKRVKGNKITISIYYDLFPTSIITNCISFMNDIWDYCLSGREIVVIWRYDPSIESLEGAAENLERRFGRFLKKETI